MINEEEVLCKGKSKPVIIITRLNVTRYESIAEAARAISISRQRLLRALKSDNGVVKGIKPTICIDYVVDE